MRKLILLLVLTFLLTSCNENKENYLGDWIEITGKVPGFSIEKFGDGYIYVSEDSTENCVQKEGKLIVNNKPILLDKSSNTILYNKKRFIKFENSGFKKFIGNFQSPSEDNEFALYFNKNKRQVMVAFRENMQTTIFLDYLTSYDETHNSLTFKGVNKRKPFYGVHTIWLITENEISLKGPNNESYTFLKKNKSP